MMGSKVKNGVALWALIALVGCGSNGSTPEGTPTQMYLLIQPPKATIQPDGHQRFKVIVKDTDGNEVKDSVH